MTDIPVPSAGEFPPPTSLVCKLAEIMGEVGTIQAKGRNDFLGTTYVTEADILNALRERLAERKIMVLPSAGQVTERPVKVMAKGKEKDSTVSTLRVTFTFHDGETGESIACDWAGSGEDPTDKGLTMASTQALRIFLMKTFLVSKDAEGAGKPPSPQARSDGQAPINEEQYQGIVEAFRAAGITETEMHEILDNHEIPREVEGEPLAVAHRVVRLSSLDAIKVQKHLVNIKAPEAVR